MLILSGWVDWADGSTFLGASQEGKGGLVLPYLQVKDAQGRWKTVIEDMGIPAGKPKTISVDSDGQVPVGIARGAHRDKHLRVLGRDLPGGACGRRRTVQMTSVDARAADLHFRGFSRPVIDPRAQAAGAVPVCGLDAALDVESDGGAVHALRGRDASW